MEAIRIAQEAEKTEEEELMRRAIEESERIDKEFKQKEEDEEAELIRQAIEASAKEEELRKQTEPVSEPVAAQIQAEEAPEVKASSQPPPE